MSNAAELLGMDDVENLAEIHDMFTAIISRCNLTPEEYRNVQRTCSNLKMLLADLSEESGQPV